MDDVLELVDLVADSELEGVFVWLLRLVGLVAVVTGLGLWLLTEMGILVLPLVLIVGGVALLVVPSVLLSIAELFGYCRLAEPSATAAISGWEVEKADQGSDGTSFRPVSVSGSRLKKWNVISFRGRSKMSTRGI